MEIIFLIFGIIFGLVLITLPFKIYSMADTLDRIYERIDDCVDAIEKNSKKDR